MHFKYKNDKNTRKNCRTKRGSIKWDIIGLSETKLFGQEILEDSNKNVFAYIGTEKGRNGVGFLINFR